jgi:hypothetical protein
MLIIHDVLGATGVAVVARAAATPLGKPAGVHCPCLARHIRGLHDPSRQSADHRPQANSAPARRRPRRQVPGAQLAPPLAAGHVRPGVRLPAPGAYCLSRELSPRRQAPRLTCHDVKGRFLSIHAP